jgi:hypothetical protein
MVVFMGFGFGPPVQRASDDDHQGATRDAGFPHPQENFPTPDDINMYIIPP